MIGNFWELCKDSTAGLICSKEHPSPSWCIPTTRTYDTIVTPEKLDHALQDTSLNENNIISCSNTNPGPQIVQTPSPAAPTIKLMETQTTKMSLSGQTIISVTNTSASALPTGTA